MIPYILKEKHLYVINVFTHIDMRQSHNHFNFRMLTYQPHSHLAINVFTH